MQQPKILTKARLNALTLELIYLNLLLDGQLYNILFSTCP